MSAMMTNSVPAWQVTAWQPVLTTAAELAAAMADLHHLGTSVDIEPGTTSFRRGQTVWGTQWRGQRVGIAWDWGEVRAGVVALADPMMILSNLYLLDDRREYLDDELRVLSLNGLVHRLPWQDAVRAHGQQRGAAPATRWLSQAVGS